MGIRLQLLCLLFFLPLLSFGQKMQISGHVHDTVTDTPVVNAVAMVVRIKDSVLLDFARTDRGGNFSFKSLPIDTVQLTVSHPKFGDREYYFFGRPDNAEFNLTKIILPEKSQHLDEVTIYAYKDPIYYKGDTLVYVADSFATKPNAVVEDLLKKLPGIKVDADGSITSQGKEITQVLVDGDEFFGADPTMATKNLSAKGVESVQVYEKKNEDATEGDETIQVLDLKLKEEAKKGYFGKASIAGDFNRFYEGELLANKFNKKQKISVFSLVSNTTLSSLRWQDAYKYGVETGFSYNEEEDSWQSDNINQGKGIPTTLKTGAYYEDQITKKTKIGVNYTYSNNTLKSYETTRSQYFLEDTSYTTSEERNSFSRNQSHSLNFSLTHEIDSLTTIEFEPRLKLSSANNESTNKMDFITEDNILNRQTLVRNTSESEGTNFKSRLSLTRHFKKKDRKLNVSYRFTYDKDGSDGKLLNDTINQQKLNNTNSMSHTVNAVYLEPLSAKFKLELDYELYSNNNDQSKKTYDFEDGSYSALNLNFSNEFENKKLQNRIGASLIFEHKKHKIIAGARFRQINVENHNLINGNIINQSLGNVLPRLRYTYKITQNNRLNFNYSTSSSLPSINQLQPVPDNTNPNRISLGNPNLLPNYMHRSTLRYNNYKPISGSYIWANLSNTIVQNGFTSSVVYDALGRTTTQTVNVNGNSFTNLYFGSGIPVFKKFLEVNPSVNAGYNRTNNFINGQKNLTVTRSLGLGLDLNIERDSIDFSIGGNLTYTSPFSSISSASSKPYYTQNYSANLILKLPLRFGIETDANYTINSQRSAGYDLDYLIWNASVTRSFGKLENLIAGVTVYDILNQNISAGRDVNSNVITDSKTNIIARYLLVKVTYKFNSTKIKESEDDF